MPRRCGHFEAPARTTALRTDILTLLALNQGWEFNFRHSVGFLIDGSTGHAQRFAPSAEVHRDRKGYIYRSRQLIQRAS